MSHLLMPYLLCLGPNIMAMLLQHQVRPFLPTPRWYFVSFVTFLHFIGFWVTTIFTLAVIARNYPIENSANMLFVFTTVVAGVLGFLLSASLDSFFNKWSDTELSAHFCGAVAGIVFLVVLAFISTNEQEVSMNGLSYTAAVPSWIPAA